MSLLFGSRYHDNEDDSFSGLMASKMRSSLDEEWGPVLQQRTPGRRRPRVIVRRRRVIEEE